MDNIDFNIPENKIIVTFTWDDNSSRHYSLLAPIFWENNFRCTFYVVPGAQEFDSNYYNEYYKLAKQGFEIGSHSFSHYYMTSLSEEQKEKELSDAAQKIYQQFNIYPLTFAFPNHDYNNLLVEQARVFHLETRNTLANSKRFSIKTKTSFQSIKDAIEEAYENDITLVFSGHSLITEQEYLNGLPGEGYEPMQVPLLKQLVAYLRTIDYKIDVITFARAALRQWIKNEGTYNGGEWNVTKDKIGRLARFNITNENIATLI